MERLDVQLEVAAGALELLVRKLLLQVPASPHHGHRDGQTANRGRWQRGGGHPSRAQGADQSRPVVSWRARGHAGADGRGGDTYSRSRESFRARLSSGTDGAGTLRPSVVRCCSGSSGAAGSAPPCFFLPFASSGFFFFFLPRALLRLFLPRAVDALPPPRVDARCRPRLLMSSQDCTPSRDGTRERRACGNKSHLISTGAPALHEAVRCNAHSQNLQRPARRKLHG